MAFYAVDFGLWLAISCVYILTCSKHEAMSSNRSYQDLEDVMRVHRHYQDESLCVRAGRVASCARTARTHRFEGNVGTHTGTIEGVWELPKAAIPQQLISESTNLKNG